MLWLLSQPIRIGALTEGLAMPTRRGLAIAILVFGILFALAWLMFFL